MINPISIFPQCAPDEEWRFITDNVIPNLKPYYYVSTYGRIFSTKSGRIMINNPDKKGYRRCILAKIDGTFATPTVYRVVMLAFCYFPGCEQLPIIHKDGNSINDVIYNLKWSNCSEIQYTSILRGNRPDRRGEQVGNSVITNDQAEYIGQLLKENRLTQREIAEIVGVPKYIVSNISNKRNWVWIYDKYNLGSRDKTWSGALFNDTQIKEICEFFVENSGKYGWLNALYTDALDNIGIVYDGKNELMRKTMAGIYHHKYRKIITDNYTWLPIAAALTFCEFPLCAPDELWRPITDRTVKGVLPGYYISSYGRLFTTIKTIGIMSPGLANGYLLASLHTNNGPVNVGVHRIVLLEFDYQPGCETMQVDHKDCNKTNNWIGNLEWVTPQENVRRAYENGLCFNANGQDRKEPYRYITDDEAYEIGLLIAEQKYTRREIAEKTDVTINMVKSIAHGDTHKSVYRDLNLGQYL